MVQLPQSAQAAQADAVDQTLKGSSISVWNSGQSVAGQLVGTLAR